MAYGNHSYSLYDSEDHSSYLNPFVLEEWEIFEQETSRINAGKWFEVESACFMFYFGKQVIFNFLEKIKMVDEE